MKTKYDWIIHIIKNGVPCACCGKVEDGFIEYACNCHTHGMGKYGHLDFQLVLHYSDEEVGRILNTLGMRVKAGERFKNGDFVKGIYLDCPVRLQEFDENGRAVLRVIIPDKHNRFPENANCEHIYKLQTLNTKELLKKEGTLQ